MNGIEVLAQEQSMLLQALLGDRNANLLKNELQGGSAREALAQRGLLAYQANGMALAERALTAAYPVLAQLIGNENFAPLAQQFWRHYPPQCGDLAQWGNNFGDYLDTLSQLADEPFLSDVARVEWSLHRAATFKDAVPDPQSFALLASDDSNETTLTLSPGVALLASAYPVVSIVNAHLSTEPTIAQAAERLSSGVKEYALVWRQGFKPLVRTSTAAEHTLLLTLQAGMSLEVALNKASACENALAEFDFNHWLGHSVQTGLITGAHVLKIPQHSPENFA